MRELSALICFLGMHSSVFSQALGDAYWNKILNHADSVVISRFGHVFFMNHIFTPEYPLEYISVGGYSLRWDDRDTITQPPDYCHFEYDIGFDRRNVGRMNILLNITPQGEMLADEDLRGFILGQPPLAFHTDLKGFIALARANGIRCKRNQAFRDLRWVPLDTAAQIHPDGVGRYELVLGLVRGERTEKLSNSVHTYLLVDCIVFDPFTGTILKKEERYETISWACGIETL